MKECLILQSKCPICTKKTNFYQASTKRDPDTFLIYSVCVKCKRLFCHLVHRGNRPIQNIDYMIEDDTIKQTGYGEGDIYDRFFKPDAEKHG